MIDALFWYTGLIAWVDGIRLPTRLCGTGRSEEIRHHVFEDHLRLLGGLDHFLGFVAFKARKLRYRQTGLVAVC
jgi:hypothetical protein